jgi:Domain of unknown function (DUF4188)
MSAIRQTVDLSSYPDLVVVYLGMRVNVWTGIKTLIGFGPKIDQSVAAGPDGLLAHENLIYSLWPPHLGMRQYWRDFESLERWTHSEPHRIWWQQFLRDTGGTGFWHELYSACGVSRPSILMCRNRSVLCDLRIQSTRREHCSLHGPA